MRAANAKAASFLAASLCCDIISVKFTNCGKETEFFTDPSYPIEKKTIKLLSYLPGSYRIRGEEYCHQIVSLCPMVHLLLQPRL